jgi:two-component sensor histidine kinase
MGNTGALVLLIDDDEGFGTLVRRDLERGGFAVEFASTGAGGLARIQAGGIDAAVLDHHLPDQDGLAVLAEIQQLENPPPVIYLTGAQDSRTAVAALKAGAADYLIKDIHGEFLALLKADIEAGIASAKLRRERDAAEAEVRAARDRYKALAQERALLLREVNHRVSNSLQLIASLLQLQSRGSSNEVKEALLEAHNRVLAVAKVHRSLYTSENVQSVALHRYLEALTEDIQSAAGDGRQPGHFTLECDPIEIEPDRAVAVGVMVTELILNARKHAYPEGGGPVRVRLRAVTEHESLLSVEDDGVGFANGRAPDQSGSGLGAIIVKAMSQKLGAAIRYEPKHPGMRVNVSFDPTCAESRKAEAESHGG